MDNRSQLLACALKLFAAHGYDAVGVQAVVEAAGVTKPTLYHYFRSKRGLLDALLDEYLAAVWPALEQALDYKHDLPLTLDRVAAVYFEFAARQRLFYRFQLSLWFAPPQSSAHKLVARRLAEQQRRLETLFERAADDHGNMRGRQRAYAATFLGMLNTYIAAALNGYTELDDALRRQAVHQFMHGIFS